MKVSIWFLLFLTKTSVAQENDEELMLKKLLELNTDYISDLKDEYSRILIEEKGDEISIKLGILANYFRIFKKIVPWGLEEKGFEHLYPVPEHDFDIEIATNCKKGLEACINYLIQQINTTQPWIIQNGMELQEGILKNVINDQRMGFEVSASQILCFMTNSRISAFEKIPYCSYKMDFKIDSGMMVWLGKELYDLKIIDELLGDPYECSTESFCPDPCCSRVPEVVRTSTKYSKLCSMNHCKKPASCALKHFENDYLFNIRLNKFNITCDCDKPGLIYRPDIGECVPHNPCTKFSLCRENLQECESTSSGHKCVCQLGYYMTKENKCAPLNITASDYHGFAHSEPIEAGNSANIAFSAFHIIIPIILLVQKQQK